jgi:hypothetical protein
MICNEVTFLPNGHFPKSFSNQSRYLNIEISGFFLFDANTWHVIYKSLAVAVTTQMYLP